MCDDERREAKLTTFIQVKRPVRSGRPLLALELEIVLVHVPTNIVQNLIVLFLGKGVDAGNLLDLPGLEYAEKDPQDIVRLEVHVW